MAEASSHEMEVPRRRRRGPPPSLYVIARQSPVPWLRVRRLGPADLPRLLAHLAEVAAADAGPGRGGLAGTEFPAPLNALDLGRVVAFGAVAGNAIIAAACAVPGQEGVEVGVTEDPGYRGRGLGDMLLLQVLGARPAATGAGPAEAGSLLLRCMARLGGRVLPLAELAATA